MNYLIHRNLIKSFFSRLIKYCESDSKQVDKQLFLENLSNEFSGSKGVHDNHYFELEDIFKLTNLVKSPTGFKFERCLAHMFNLQVGQIVFKRLQFVKTG